MKHLIRALALILALLPATGAFCQAPQFPQNLPANTVIGRLGIGSGPSQAIPFANLVLPVIGNAFVQFAGPITPIKTFTLPNANGTIALLNQIQTWTGAQSHTDGTLILLGLTSGSTTLKAPATGGGTATLFPGSDTIMGVATAQTPTNKIFNCANNTCTVRIANDVTGLGTGVATALGVNVGTAGAFVVNGGALGTPSSGTLTSATGLPLSTGVTGTLQAAQEPAHTGDCTNSAGSLALTCLKTNGTSFTAGATAAAGQLPGEPSNGSAAAGNVGEYPAPATSASTGITTGTQTNITSISLTAGDWDVWGEIIYTPAASTNVVEMWASLSLTSATLDQTLFNYSRLVNASAGIVPGAVNIPTWIGPRRVSISATTTVFLVGFTNFTVSTMTTVGGIRARRVR